MAAWLTSTMISSISRLVGRGFSLFNTPHEKDGPDEPLSAELAASHGPSQLRTIEEDDAPVGSNDDRDFETAAVPDQIVRLQVGEQMFLTTRDTLQSGSGYFAARFSDRWHEEVLQDGTYFVDADGDLFEHCLRFMRHGSCPLFWTKDNGFDYVKYASLQASAVFFMMNDLEDWIKGRK